MLLRWSAELAVGVDTIDAQHEELFRRAGALLEALHGSRGPQEIARLFPFLEEYAIEHFAAEEALMSQHGYPRMAEHVAQHRKLVEDLVPLKASLMKHGMTAKLASEASHFLQGWLLRHVAVSDQVLGAFILAKEGRDAVARACGMGGR